VLDLTMIGTVRPRRMLVRAGAKPGDEVFVSGMLGAARAGLEMCTEDPARAPADRDPDSPRGRYLRPEPRVRLGLMLGRNQAATACMDLSDGLADGLRQIARASHVGLTIDAEALPIDPAARAWLEARGRDPVDEAIAGGDDYELLFTVSPRRTGRLKAVARLVRGLRLTRIGTVTRETGLVVRREGHSEALPAGFAHFGG
jgi:thiamine-monophosphate kinase